MAWFKDKKDEDLPESLRGKTPEQVVQELKDAADTKARLVAIEAENQTNKAAFDSQKSEFDSVKAQLAAINAAGRQNPSNNNEEVNFFENPEKSVDQRIAPLAQLTAINGAQTAKILAQQQLDNQDFASPADAKTMDGRLFRAWASEIDAETKKYNVQQLISPQAWLGVFYYLKGLHADELANPETRKKKYNFVEPGQTIVTARQEPSNLGDKLTDQELHVAEKMGIKAEDYLKRKKAMQFISG